MLQRRDNMSANSRGAGRLLPSRKRRSSSGLLLLITFGSNNLRDLVHGKPGDAKPVGTFER